MLGHRGAIRSLTKTYRVPVLLPLVAHHVGRDAKKPRRQVVVSPRRVLESPKIRFLDGVSREILVLGEPDEVPEERVMMFSKQCFEVHLTQGRRSFWS